MELPQTLPAQLYLLAYDVERRRFAFGRGDRWTEPWLFSLAMRAAMLTDLYLTGHVKDQDGKACLPGGAGAAGGYGLGTWPTAYAEPRPLALGLVAVQAQMPMVAKYTDNRRDREELREMTFAAIEPILALYQAFQRGYTDRRSNGGCGGSGCGGGG